jgi:hypothetical protein
MRVLLLMQKVLEGHTAIMNIVMLWYRQAEYADD